jgi:rubrerythrin
MSDRKSLKIRGPTADRFERYQRDGESQTDALARLLDKAGVPEILRCAECGTTVQAHARDDDGRIMCFDCAGIDPAQVP